MKKVFIGMALAAFVATGAFAQDQSNGFADRPKSHQRTNQMQQLNLSDDQKNELKTINEDFKQQMTDLKKNEDKITVTEWKSKMATIRKDHHEKIQNVLTPEQKANLKTMMSEHKGGMRFMRKHGAHRFERMKKDLNLTDDQVTALKKNHEDMEQKFKALRDDKSLTADQKKVEIKKFREQQHESLKSILTADQLQKLEQQKKKHNHHRQQPPVQS